MAATFQASSTSQATFSGSLASARNANNQIVCQIVGDLASVTLTFDTVEDLNRLMSALEDAKQAGVVG